MNFLWQTGIRVTPIEADQQCLQFFMRNSFAKSLTRSHGFQIFSIDYRSNRFFSSTTATKLIRRILVQSDEASSFMDQWSLFFLFYQSRSMTDNWIGYENANHTKTTVDFLHKNHFLYHFTGLIKNVLFSVYVSHPISIFQKIQVWSVHWDAKYFAPP